MTKKLWAGLDVGTRTTAICVIDDAGEILHETTCPTQLQSVRRELRLLSRRRHAKIVLEATTGINLARGLRSLGYQVELYEQRQLTKFLRLRRNKTDAGDAMGIAEAARLGASTVSRVHLKSLECQFLQSRLAIRRQLIRQRVASTNALGRLLSLYGGRLRSAKPARLRANAEAEIRLIFRRTSTALIADLRNLVDHCEYLFGYQAAIDAELKQLAFENEVCRRFMDIPGVGPLCALNFYVVVSDPSRFGRSADIGSYLGLTPLIVQSGLMLKRGRISKMGNRPMRALLVGSSMTFMQHAPADSDLRSWAAAVEQRRGRKKARVALARKLATVMIAMWKSGDSYEARRGRLCDGLVASASRPG